jgi:hypothetical protein
MNGNVPVSVSGKGVNINGVVLTEKAIARLCCMQAEDNGLLKSMIKDLTAVARLLSMEWPSTNVEAQKSLYIISGMFAICDHLESLFAAQQEGDAS